MEHTLVAPRVYNNNGTDPKSIKADARHCAMAILHLEKFMRANLMPHGRDYQTLGEEFMGVSQEAREEFIQMLARLGEVEEYCRAVFRNADDPSLARERYSYRQKAALDDARKLREDPKVSRRVPKGSRRWDRKPLDAE